MTEWPKIWVTSLTMMFIPDLMQMHNIYLKVTCEGGTKELAMPFIPYKIWKWDTPNYQCSH